MNNNVDENHESKKKKNIKIKQQQQQEEEIVDDDKRQLVIGLASQSHQPKIQTLKIRIKKPQQQHEHDEQQPIKKIKKNDETHKLKRVLENGVEEVNKKKKKKPILKKVEQETHELNNRVSENGFEETKNKKQKLKNKEESFECRFPFKRIVRLIKSEGAFDCRFGREAVFLINKATEKFIELFSEDAYDNVVQEKRSSVGYRHLSSVVAKEKRLDFLSDFVPKKITAEKALAELKSPVAS